MRKRNLTSLLAALSMLILICFGSGTADAIAKGIDVCLRTVIPSLFPFFVLSILLVGNAESWTILAPLGKLFRIPSGAESVLLTGLLGGYPVGAKAASEAYEQGRVSAEEANRLLHFCSQGGPGFIFGMAASVFPSFRWGLALWIVQLVSAWLVSRVVSPSGDGHTKGAAQRTVSLPEALSKAVRVMAEVCGWVILFRLLIHLTVEQFAALPLWWRASVSGLLELTNGILLLSSISGTELRFVLCSAMLSFGGLCVLMQTRSAARGLDIKCYLGGKLLQTVFSLLLSVFFTGKNISALLSIIFLGIMCPKMQKRAGNQPRVVV